MSTSKIIRKTLEEAQGLQRAEIDFSEKNLVHLDDMPRLWTMANVTRLTLAHNKIVELPAAMANLENMEILNLFNNSLEDVPSSLSSMPKLRYVVVLASMCLLYRYLYTSLPTYSITCHRPSTRWSSISGTHGLSTYILMQGHITANVEFPLDGFLSFLLL
jgi:Leucine-rich repeat (LRR) protein